MELQKENQDKITDLTCLTLKDDERLDSTKSCSIFPSAGLTRLGGLAINLGNVFFISGVLVNFISYSVGHWTWKIGIRHCMFCMIHLNIFPLPSLFSMKFTLKNVQLLT